MQSKRSYTKSRPLTVVEKAFSEADYIDYKKNSQTETSVWYYFLRRNDGQKGWCKLCKKVDSTAPCIIPCKSCSHGGMLQHLKNKHNISWSVQDATIEDEEDGENPGIPSEPSHANRKAMKMTSYFKPKKDSSMDAMIAELISSDGLSFATIANSNVLRKLFKAAGYDLPKSHDTIKIKFEAYTTLIKQKQIVKISEKLRSGKKFSLSVDEWTAVNSKRYVNLNLHDQFSHVNLGLIPIPVDNVKNPGSLDAKECLKLVLERLKDFGVSPDDHIVSCTSDGASMMKKFGTLAPFNHQQCIAHAIQLGVIDVLYAVKKSAKSTKSTLVENEPVSDLEPESEVEDEDNDEDEDEDDDEDKEENNEELIENLTDEEDETESDADSDPNFQHVIENVIENREIRPVIQKVRTIVRMFRKSPVKLAYLKTQTIKDFKKPLRPILDCRTRWSSLYCMLERYLALHGSISKTIIDLRAKKVIKKKKKLPEITEEDVSTIEDVVNALTPVKLGLEKICREDATLLSCDSLMELMLTKLMGQSSTIAAKLFHSLKKRILERRTKLFDVLSYLHNGPVDSENENSEVFKFPNPNPATVKKEVKCLLTRLLQDRVCEYPNSDDDVTELRVKPTKSTSRTNPDQGPMSIEHEFENAISTLLEPTNLKKAQSNRGTKLTLGAHISHEIETFLNSLDLKETNRGYHLKLVYEYLLTVKPTSVEAERAFSAAALFCTKLRNALGDKALDSLCFLRAYFKALNSSCSF